MMRSLPCMVDDGISAARTWGFSVAIFSKDVFQSWILLGWSMPTLDVLVR